MKTEINPADAAVLVRRFYERFDEGRLDAVEDIVSPEFSANVLGTTPLDWDGFKQFGKAFRKAFPDGRHVFDHVVSDGENVMTTGIYEGTQTGEIHGIGPTHRQIRLAVMHLDRVRDGKIVEHRGLANEADFVRQLNGGVGE